MDLHLLTYFVAVVDHGGVTKAAQALYISQPSLSQAIRTLEKRLGATLFDRAGGRLTLTDDGRRLYAAARRILIDVENAKARVVAVRALEAGRVDLVTYAAFSVSIGEKTEPSTKETPMSSMRRLSGSFVPSRTNGSLPASRKVGMSCPGFSKRVAA